MPSDGDFYPRVITPVTRHAELLLALTVPNLVPLTGSHQARSLLEFFFFLCFGQGMVKIHQVYFWGDILKTQVQLRLKKCHSHPPTAPWSSAALG